MAAKRDISSVRDSLITILAVWLMLSIAGAIGALAPSRDAISWVASAAFVILLAGYALWPGPGRRSGAPIYMASGITLLPLSFALLFFILATERYQLEWLIVGGNVGYNPGGMDSGALFGGFIWWLSVMLLLAVSLAPRALFSVAARDN
ncbi:MAG TPA: hypothetical protein VEW71_10280 [Allosphingosinicella sp.]|nr:hypothetical protein [Allosphingosinicella sp.]